MCVVMEQDVGLIRRFYCQKQNATLGLGEMIILQARHHGYCCSKLVLRHPELRINLEAIVRILLFLTSILNEMPRL
jgi:hypothetical protein